MTGTWLGIDVGGTSVRVGLGSRRGEGEPARRASAPTPGSLDEFLVTVERLAADVGLAAAADGIGVGLPGVVSPGGGRWVPNVPYLATPGLAHALTERLGGPVTFGNDAQLALLGEHRVGAAAGCASAMLVSVGTGIGGALLLDGRIVRGAHGSAGAMGWFVPDPADAGDSELGALERRAAGPALERMARELKLPRGSYGLISAAREGDEAASAAVAAVGRDLGAAIAGVGSVIDPEIIVVAGGLASAFDLLAPPIAEAMARWASPQMRTVKAVAATLGDDAGLVGAVHAAREGGNAWW